MTHRGLVEVCGPVRILEAVAKAVEAEVRQPAAPSKGDVRVAVDDGCLRVEVESPTLSGLRALLNSYLYLIHAAYSALEAAGLE